MAKRTLSNDDILSLLTAAPPGIARLTAGLSPAQLRAAPAEGEWSANEVLAHLRNCADVWGGCMARILAEERPTIRAVNPRTWARSTHYPELAFGPSLHAFSAQRAELLALLEPLPPEAWERTAKVTGAGRPLVRTVHFYAEWLATHERTHIKQIGRTVEVVRG